MSRREVPTHYLRGNETCWSPGHVGFFDTEAMPIEEGEQELLELRLWCAQAFRRGDPEPVQHPDARADGHTGPELADWVESQLVGEDSLWLYAHNLSFDLTTTRLLTVLTGRGWAVTGFGGTDRAPWFRLKRRTKRLVLADSWSWLPDRLEAIGELVGVRKPALPNWSADDADWLVRCYGDVDTTAAAVLALLDWWDREQLGRWTITGAATGWNAMRHMSRRRALLVDPDPDARAFEREAVRGGRRDVWRTGRSADGPYAHIDIERAHATIAEYLPLPVRRMSHFDSLRVTDPVFDHPWRSVMARCRVTTVDPRYPVRIGGTAWWPVGTFWTVLAGPELAMARDRGELDEIGEGYFYRLHRHLSTWARWANRLAAGQVPTAPAAAQLAAKAWGRSVVGKFAAHATTLVQSGTALHDGPFAERFRTVTSRTNGTTVTLGGEEWRATKGLDSDDCFPAVLAWVESHLRVRMAAIIDRLPESTVVAVDTDGLVVDLPRLVLHWPKQLGRWWKAGNHGGTAQAVCDLLAPTVAPLRIRPTRLFRTVNIRGPQQVTLGGERSWAGVPRAARPSGRRQVKAQLWPKLFWQLAHGDPRGYVRPTVTYRLAPHTVHRWVLAGGAPLPVVARVTPEGETVINRWGWPGPASEAPRLATYQYPPLAALLL